MGGVVLETVSNRKLLALGICFAVGQLTTFLLGGLLAPAPYNTMQVLATRCFDDKPLLDHDRWFEPWGPNNCTRIEDLSHIEDGNSVVFAFRFPLPRDSTTLDMSRWFQNVIAVLHVEKPYKPDYQQTEYEEAPIFTMDARLGYKDKGDDKWTELSRSTETRKLECTPPEEKQEGYISQCDTMPFFEIGSCHHDYYLVNVRVPSDEMTNADIGYIENLWVVEIHQNGGFTKVWFTLKTTLFPVLVGVLVWFTKRVWEQERSTNLLESMLFALGVSLSFLDLPVEWLTLWMHMPFMLLFSDIRQGIFYTVLLSFWIIFAGEHLMDQVERNKLVMYWKHLSAVAFGCICLFVFEMCERGVQLQNPFYSIWSTETGTKLAQGFLVLAMISACVYFCFLFYMVICVFRNISAKKGVLPAMPKARQKFYLGLIFRFKFLMVVTLLCAALSVVGFILAQVSEGHWKWGDSNSLEYTSAVQTGVYGMWNLYVICLLILYAPSHKNMVIINGLTDTDDGSNEEHVEFSTIPTETSALSGMVSKANQD